MHIHDYRSHNLFHDPLFRLNQFEKLAQRFLDISQNNEVDSLIIAGDFFHVAAPRPLIVNRAIEFLERLTEKLHVYIIHGNHDLDTRSSSGKDSTLLTVCNRLPRVHYCHKEFVKIDGCQFYFLGWVPQTEEEIEVLKSKGGTDVFIGHFQPGTVRIGQRGYFLEGGLTIPNTPPWKIGFVGDIHTHQVTTGNLVIPGVPVQHNFNDPPDPGVILFDTKTALWERIPTCVPGKWDFLQLIITDESLPTQEWTVVRSETQTESIQLQRTFEKRLDIPAVIQEQVTHHHLETLHMTLLSCVPKEVCEEVNLNFILLKIIIHNFRSIEHFEWTIDEGVVLLYGKNGTGKSSLVNAIMFALSGEGAGRALKRKGSDSLFVEVTLFYGGFKHTLRRGWSTSGKFSYWINDIEQQAENQRALGVKIEENLSFLRFSDLLYHQQDRPGFLSSYNYAARVDLVSRVLGLRIVQYLYEEAQQRLLDLDRQLTALRARIATITATLEQEALVEITFMEVIEDDGKENSLTILRDAIRSLVREERQKHEEIHTKKTFLAHTIQRATDDVTALERRRNQLRRKICYTCGQTIDDANYETLFHELNEELFIKARIIIEHQNELDHLEMPSTGIVEKLEDRFEQVIARLAKITSLREHSKNVDRLKYAIERAKIELVILRTEYASLLSERECLNSYKDLVSSSGPIMRTLLITLSEMFSTKTVRVKAHKQLVGGEIRPDFTVDIQRIDHTWIPYDDASGGEKTLADLTVLSKLVQLVGGVGLLIFDESLKFLDEDNVELIVEVLKTLQCSHIVVASHLENFPYWDTSIRTTVDTDGLTKYTLL